MFNKAKKFAKVIQTQNGKNSTGPQEQAPMHKGDGGAYPPPGDGGAYPPPASNNPTYFQPTGGNAGGSQPPPHQHVNVQQQPQQQQQQQDPNTGKTCNDYISGIPWVCGPCACCLRICCCPCLGVKVGDLRHAYGGKEMKRVVMGLAWMHLFVSFAACGIGVYLNTPPIPLGAAAALMYNAGVGFFFLAFIESMVAGVRYGCWRSCVNVCGWCCNFPHKFNSYCVKRDEDYQVVYWMIILVSAFSLIGVGCTLGGAASALAYSSFLSESDKAATDFRIQYDDLKKSQLSNLLRQLQDLGFKDCATWTQACALEVVESVQGVMSTSSIAISLLAVLVAGAFVAFVGNAFCCTPNRVHLQRGVDEKEKIYQAQGVPARRP